MAIVKLLKGITYSFGKDMCVCVLQQLATSMGWLRLLETQGSTAQGNQNDLSMLNI